jgi:phosphoglycerate kinase
MKLKSVRDLDVAGKRVLVGVDYNVPLKDGQVADTLRIAASLETIKYLLDQGCSLVLMSHLGRPEGAVNPAMSLAPVAVKLAELLGRPVAFAADCVGPTADAAVAALQPGEVLLLENVRFHAEEEANDPDFAKALAAHCEVFVDDAFANIHRAHASVVGVAAYLPSAAGFLVEKEVAMLVDALQYPDRPLVSIIAGAKVSGKIEVLSNLLEKSDVLMIGGAMANTFFVAQGLSVGRSILEADQVPFALELLKKAKSLDKVVVFPDEVVVSKSLTKAEGLQTIPVKTIKSDQYIVDAAPSFSAKLPRLITEFLDFNNRATVVWNGPLGIIEVPEFAVGSRRLAETIANDVVGRSIIGGGDTASVIDGLGMHDRFTWISTGGGASLDLMAGKELPGLKVLVAD